LSYLDRLREGKYTSPSGKIFLFQFDDLGRTDGKKSAVHEIPQTDLSIVQDLGCKTTGYKIDLYFSGVDYDETADAFRDALRESGPGTLAHPRWGDLPVLAVSFDQNERFVEGMGRADFSVEFIHAPKVCLSSSAITSAAVASAGAIARAASKASYIQKAVQATLADFAEVKNRVRSTLRTVRRTTARIIGGISTISQTINAQILSITADLDALLASPAEFAAAIDTLIAACAEAPIYIVDKVTTYYDIIAGTTETAPVTEAQAQVAVLVVSAATASAIQSSTTGTLESRAEAISAHDTLATLYESARSAIEAAEAASGIVADPETMQAMAAAYAQAAAYLLAASYNLRIERRTTLTGEATPLELVYRFYKNLDRLDEFERQNNLEGDALLIVPTGREVRYYAE